MIYDVGVSFLNASIGISSPNSSVCLGNITALNASFALIETQFSMKLYDKMGATIKRMIQSVDPITFACYFSGFEYFQVLWEDLKTILDINKLTYNLFHNAGAIYDATTDLISNFRFNTPYDRTYWKRIGNDIGLIINQVSYKPKDYDPYTKTPVTPKV